MFSALYSLATLLSLISPTLQMGSGFRGSEYWQGVNQMLVWS